MIDRKLSLINEQTSPLFRIMTVYSHANVQRRAFTNNICAFHIGNGYILSVAHNLRSESAVINVVDETFYQNELATKIDSHHPFHQQYKIDVSTATRHLFQSSNSNLVSETLKQINFDTRWISLYEKKICTPFLIIQLTEDSFYQDKELTKLFNNTTKFHEPSLNRYTFLVELELAGTYFSDDIALYRIVNTDQRIISKLPSIEVGYDTYDVGTPLFCLQSAPIGFLGRLLNTATVEGFLDHHSIFPDRIGGNYIMEGLRYLIRGYFRFGSSGAPYIFFDGEQFKVAGVQSEASPIQLSINNNREGNFQYVNAIATPLVNIRSQLENIF